MTLTPEELAQAIAVEKAIASICMDDDGNLRPGNRDNPHLPASHMARVRLKALEALRAQAGRE